MGDKQDFLDLGLLCADICKTLERELEGKRSDELNWSVHETIETFTT